jgi:hypothetical protein
LQFNNFAGHHYGKSKVMRKRVMGEEKKMRRK